MPLIMDVSSSPSTLNSSYSAHVAAALKNRWGRSAEDICGDLIRHDAVAPVLLVCFSEGWDKLRAVAIDVMEKLVLPTSCCGKPQGTKGGVERSLLSKKDVDEAIEMLNAKTLRDAEGAANVLCLATNPQATEADAFSSILQTPAVLDDRNSPLILVLLRWAQGALVSSCNDHVALGADLQAIQQHLHDRPIHGLLTLCALLIRKIIKTTTTRDSSASTQTLVSALAELCENQLKVSVIALQVSMRLVSALEAGGSNENELDEAHETSRDGLKVDCRGHVYHDASSLSFTTAASRDVEQISEAASKRLHAQKQAFSRTVVNNSWLGVRTAAGAVEASIAAVPIESLSLTNLTNACTAVIDTLLQTKHNGVMSKSRQALKSLAELLLRSRNPQYYAVPANLLDSLLGVQGVTSDNEARILRRSQGLTHAILAVLEAEDPSVPFVLFPKTLTFLLDVVHGQHPAASTCNASLLAAHRVNGLNVMKFVFDNHHFSSRIIPFIEEAFLVSAEGFRHVSWAVRNSSLMLFSSVLHRCIGDHPSTGGGGVNTSLHDLALRMPRGVAFVQKELRIVVEETLRGHAVQPALFPLLLLLSMLCPDAPHVIVAAHVGEASSLSASLIDLVLRCRNITNTKARSASAAALSSLVSVPQLSETIAALGNVLTSETIGHNELHGALVHLQRLFMHYVGSTAERHRIRLSSNCTPSISAGVYNDVLLAFCRSRENIARILMNCPTNAALYFSILGDMTYFFGSLDTTADSSALQHHLLSNTIHCAISSILQHAAQPSEKGEGAAPRPLLADVTCMQSSIAKLLCVLSYQVFLQRLDGSSDVPSQAITLLLATDAAAVTTRYLTNEHSVIVWAAHHISGFSSKDAQWVSQSGNIQCLANIFTREWSCCVTSSLIQLVPKLLGEKDTLWEIARAQKLGVALRYLTEVAEANDLPTSLFSAVAGRVQDESHIAVKSWGMRCLAQLVAARLTHDDGDKSVDLSAHVIQLLDTIARNAASSSPLECRLASAVAISKLLACVGKCPTPAALGAVLFRLLSDDDSSVREVAAVVVSKLCLSTQEGGVFTRSHFSCCEALAEWIRLHRLVDERSASSSTVSQSLLRIIIEEDSGAAPAAREACSDDDQDSDADDDDVLFEVESDNLFAERAVLRSWLTCMGVALSDGTTASGDCFTLATTDVCASTLQR